MGDSDGGGRQRPRPVGLERHTGERRGGWQRQQQRKMAAQEADNKAILEALRAIVREIKLMLEKEYPR